MASAIVAARLAGAVRDMNAANAIPMSSPTRNRGAVLAIARSVVLEALRGRLGWLALLVLITGVALGEFVAAISITESRGIALLVLAAWLRLAMVFVLALFVVASMVRDFNDKGMELVLALPISRSAYLLGRLLGYLACALSAGVLCALLLCLHLPVAGALAWSASFTLELFIVAAMGCVCALSLVQVPAAMTALAAFYLLARAMAGIELMARSAVAGGGHGVVGELIGATVRLIDLLLPDLDALARSEWLTAAGAPLPELLSGLGIGAVYFALLVGVALFDMQRKVL